MQTKGGGDMAAAVIISAIVGAAASVYSATQTPSAPDTDTVPALTPSDSAVPVATGTVKEEVKEATSLARRDQLTKQALAKAKYSTIKTGGLGLSGGVLNTARKSLLGG